MSAQEEAENQHVSISIIQFVANSAKVERDLTNSEIARLRDEIKALKEQNELRFKMERRAWKSFFVELKRRLKGLNHGHAEIVAAQGHYLPREIFDQFKDQNFSPWRDMVNAFQNNLI